ncbi:MAG: HupE/UreJ family protein [Bacteroidota bacterium]
MRLIAKLTLLVAVVSSFLLPSALKAHAPDQSYLYLRIYKEAVEGRFEFTAKDLNKALGLNLPEAITLNDVKPYLTRIQNYLKERSGFQANGQNFSLRFLDPTVLTLDEEEDYAQFNFALDGMSEVPETIDITYGPLFEVDKKHRGMLIVEHNWKAGIFENEALVSNIYSPGNIQQSLSLADTSVWKGFWALVKLGIWHIWIGLDHILFLFALILPSVVRRRKNTDGSSSWSWVPVEDFKSAFWYILKIVTFFTIAHSITLALASLKIINLPSSLVESIIAISIALAAFHNIRPIFKSREWIIAFGFGLFHGFGFASVLGEKGLSGDFMAYSLLGFNLGVEIGQVAIICLIFPVLYLIRKHKAYPKLINYGSILLILISIYWFIERAFGIDLPLGAYVLRLKEAIFG